MPVSWGQSDAHKHDWSAWSAWGEKDSNCVQTRIRYCKDVINCGNTEEETKTNHSMERHQVNGVWVKACHYCSATG
jgi:hypothetical protein